MWRIPQENCTQDIIVPRKFPRNYPKEGCPLGNCLTENCLPPIDLFLFNSPKYVVLTQLLQSYNLVDSPLGGLILAVELPVYFSRYSWLLQNFFCCHVKKKCTLNLCSLNLWWSKAWKTWINTINIIATCFDCHILHIMFVINKIYSHWLRSVLTFSYTFYRP